MREKYIIKKVLSNNVILVTHKDKEYILVGKGVGFGKKKDSVLEDVENVENTFISLEGLDKYEYEQLLSKVDKKIAAATEEIIAMISKTMGEELNPNIHIGLIDHINFAIKRLQENIDIINPFLTETKIMYPKEYELAQEAVEILKEKLNIQIPDAEIGFIAFHIHGALKSKDKAVALKITKLVNNLIKTVEDELHIAIKRDSFDYVRFVIHIRGIISRLENDKVFENPLLDKIKEQFEFEFGLALKLGKIIENELKIKVPEDELAYMAMHIHKLKEI